MRPPRLVPALVAVSIVGSLAACSENDSATSTYSVESSDDACTVEKSEFEPGPITFTVSNSGSDVTEVYVYGEKDGQFSEVIDEVEDIGPGASRELDVDLGEGRYQVTCKPGMVGDGIATVITVAESG